MRLLALALLSLSGCRFAQIRYLDGAEHSREVACVVVGNELLCRDYFQALAMDGVTLVPRSRTRETSL